MRTSMLLLAVVWLGFSAAQFSTSTDASTSLASTPSSSSSASSASPSPTTTVKASTNSTVTSSSASSTASSIADVHLKVPELHVGRIELDVDDLSADINLQAQVANLVTLNAGISVGISKVNITIADVDAELELTIRLGQLVEIVNRTLASLDLNPTLINLLNNITEVADDVITEVVGAVDGLLGSVTQGSTTLDFVIDNLGNIVQSVTSDADTVLSQIVGNYVDNMTFTGDATTLSNNLVQKTYSYTPLGALVDIVFNAAGQVVQATVNKSSTLTSSTATATASASTSSSVAASTTAA